MYLLALTIVAAIDPMLLIAASVAGLIIRRYLIVFIGAIVLGILLAFITANLSASQQLHFSLVQGTAIVAATVIDASLVWLLKKLWVRIKNA